MNPTRLNWKHLAFAAFWCAMPVFSAIGQYDIKLYRQLLAQQKTAKTNTKKLSNALALADYHSEQSALKGFPSSSDSAYHHLDKAKKIATALNSSRDLALTYLGYSKMLEFELKYGQSIEYANKAIAILEKQPDKKALAKAYRAMYNSYRYANPPDKAIEMAEKALKVSLESKDDAIIGKAYENLAESTSLLRDYGRTLPLLEKARHHYEKGKVRDQKSLYAFYGMLYTSMNHHAEALVANLKAVEIIEKYKIQDYYNITVYMTAGNMYRDMQRFDTAIEFYEKAYAELERYDLPRYNVILGRFLSNTYIKQKKFDKAEKYLKICESWYSAVDDAYKDFVLMAVLDGYTDIGKPQLADRYVPAAIEYLDTQEQKKPTYASLSFALAKYYFANKNFPEARRRTQATVDYLGQTPARYKLNEAYRMLYTIDSMQGNFPSAMKNYNLANICKDSVTNLAKLYQLAELEMKYDIAQKSSDNRLLKKQGELQQATLSKTMLLRNISLGGILLLVLILFLIYRKFRITQKLRKLLAARNDQLQETLKDKDVLINEKEWLLKEIHHRVKNNLQIVMSLLNSQSYFLNDEVAKKAIENSQHRIHSMSLIHKKLYQSDNIAKINMAVYFWELMEYYKVAFDTEGRIRFQLEVDPIELESAQAVPIGLILNETVNNALKHAFPDNRPGHVKVSLKSVGDNLAELKVSDDGIGYSGTPSDAAASLGMKLIHGFAKDLQGKLSFTSEKGLEVTLRFAVNRNAEGEQDWKKISA